MNSALIELPDKAAPNLRNPRRDAAIIEARATGETIAKTAELANCSKATVERVTKEHSELIERKRREAGVRFLRRIEGVVDAQVGIASDPDNRNAVNAYQALCETLLGWGGKGTQVHIGDNVTTVFDQSQHVHLGEAETDDDRQRRLERRKRLGLD